MKKIGRTISIMLAMLLTLQSGINVSASEKSVSGLSNQEKSASGLLDSEALIAELMDQEEGISGLSKEEMFPSEISYSEIGSEIEAYVAEHEETTAGLAVSVFDRDETIYSNYFGYADKENQTAVDEETVFEWGSVTKLLVWVSVMQLWEQGELEFDCDVRTYLPENFLTNLSYDQPVTMLHLMNHNAGFQEVYFDIFSKEGSEILSLGEILAAHKPDQIYEPGTVTAYSNWGVALAGYIVECVSGMQFSDYVHEHIFEPLGMEHSALLPDLSDNEWVQEKRKDLQCYTADGTLIPGCFYHISMYPAGMCTSTLGDFEQFARTLLDENSVLFQSADTWKTMFSPTAYYGDSEIPSNCHGFWVIPLAVKAVGHGGNTAGCSSYLLLEPESGIGTVVMTNQYQENVYNTEMMRLIFGEFQEEAYFSGEREEPSGIYRSARTVRVGPLKILSMAYESGEWEDDTCWVYSDSQGAEKVTYAYADIVRVSTAEFALEIGITTLMLIGLLFSLISLLARLIRRLIYLAKGKTPAKLALGAWSIWSGILQMLVLILIFFAVMLISSYEPSKNCVWVFVLMCIIAVLMTGMAVYGLMKFRKTPGSRKMKVYHAAVLFSLIITVVNILYWNMFMFWMV